METVLSKPINKECQEEITLSRADERERKEKAKKRKTLDSVCVFVCLCVCLYIDREESHIIIQTERWRGGGEKRDFSLRTVF